jgi:hypothetical protein
LISVNLLGQRSFNDLSQYPVFPWILANYTSDSIDLNDESNYRDLLKPIGTLNEQRIRSIRIQRAELAPDDPTNSFYRQHYSNPFYTCLFLVRMEPFTTIHVEISDKRFDKTGRMFSSIPQSWSSVTDKVADFRELTPEFFCLPEFLINENLFDLGEGVNDVILPPWAHNSPHEFIEKHRQALESEIVSSHLHEWINLIFSFQQSGPAAIAAENTFNPACYATSLTREARRDPDQMREIRSTALFVGIIPVQVFTSPHPKKLRISRFPTFNPSFVTIFELPKVPRYLAFDSDVVYVFNDDCQFFSFSLSKRILSPMGSIYKAKSLSRHLHFSLRFQDSCRVRCSTTHSIRFASTQQMSHCCNRCDKHPCWER